MRKHKYLFLLLGFLAPFIGLATHNRAGEITYKHVNGFTYDITITTYTESSSVQADRCSLTLNFGDGTSEEVYRVNGGSCSNGQPPCSRCGQDIGNNIKKNIYTTTHTYAATGSYTLSMLDPNRNEGVLNITNSVQVPFYIYSELIIFPDGRPNSSPVLYNPPVDNGCLNVLYEHNPGAVDEDIAINGKSDSLSYRLVICRGDNGQEIPGFVFPDQVNPGSNNVMWIDALTGTLSWDAPRQVGEYNVAILIEEWRKIGNAVVKVGSILRDLQIDVDVCRQNNPPQIAVVDDTCITATKFIGKNVTAIDNDFLPPGFTIPQSITLSATGDPFETVGNKASFPTRTSQKQVTQSFTWSTECIHVRTYPYFVVFRAQDNHPDVELTDYQDWRIQVLGPPPINVEAEPVGAGINVKWDYSQCSNAIGYRIYRKTDSIGYEAPVCVTGIPTSTGYVQVGSTIGNSETEFFDNDGGVGLISGQRYCYMVYAVFDDGAESYPSVEVCATLLREVPIITRVSINTTDIATGSDTVKWAKPTELDQVKHPGPYQYKILRRDKDTDYVEIGSSIIDSDLEKIDTLFIDQNLNTLEKRYDYKIEIYGQEGLIGPSRPASSPRLIPKPLDNRMELSLDIDVPWSNSTMYVYRKNNAGTFVFLDSANSLVYTDSNLVNGVEYCYYVTTKGGYSDPELEFPLWNNSQILCAIPIDKQAPCPPQQFEVDSDCEAFVNDLTWLNPNVTCDSTDDVVSYNVYYRPFQEGELEVISQLDGSDNTGITYSDLFSVAGCYAITAIDSFNNESPFSDIICVDNCPIYELPDIFTPGNDGQNDDFGPMYGWRYVDRVEMHVFNRWGEEVYASPDPELGWNGNNKEGDPLPSGTYFYVCKVFEIRLAGIMERDLTGTITLQREEPGSPNN